MSEDVKLTIYMPEELKEELASLAKQHEPRTNMSAFSLFLLRQGIADYKRLNATINPPRGVKVQ